MNRVASLALAVAALTPIALVAQSNSKPDLSRQVIGVWEGPYQSEAASPGTLRLTVIRAENREWKATLEIFSDQAPPAGEVRNFMVEGDTVSWVQTVADLDCYSKATIVGGLLKGTAECSQGGTVALTAGFLLERKKP